MASPAHGGCAPATGRRRSAAIGAAGHCSSPASTVASLISAALLAVSSVSVLVFASPRRSARAIGPLRLGQLLAVTAAELLEPFRVVAVPLAQHRGGSDLLAPLVQAGLLLSHAPRPDPVHQHPGAVPRGGIIINPAHLNFVQVTHWFVASCRCQSRPGRGLDAPAGPRLSGRSCPARRPAV